jgi:hypothetical protein
MNPKDVTDDMLRMVNALINFEDLLAAYYRLGAEHFQGHAEFWRSASIAKETRASLFTNLRLDVEANTSSYALQKNMSGTYLARLNQLRDRLIELRKNRLEEPKYFEFTIEIESFLQRSQSNPLLTGSTGESDKINKIAGNIQDRQVRLLTGLRSYQTRNTDSARAISRKRDAEKTP